MFDWLRNMRKSAEEKRQEAITAYLDEALPARERERFEAALRQDADLRAEVEGQRQIKRLLSQAPRLKAPRSFVLDPAVYGKPQPARAAVLYPRLRTATLVATLLFAVSLTLNLFPGAAGMPAAAPAPQESAAVFSEAAPAEEPAAEILAEAPAAAEMAAEDSAEEAMEAMAAPAEMEAAVEESAGAASGGAAEVSAEMEMAAPGATATPPATAGALAQADSGVTGQTAPEATEKALSPRPTATTLAARVAPTAEPTAAAEISAAPESPPAENGEAAAPLGRATPVSPTRLLQLVLGLLTLLLLAATVAVRLRSR